MFGSLPPQPLPGIPDLLLWQCPPAGVGLEDEDWTMLLQSPNPPRPMHHYIHLSQRFRPVTRGWSVSSLSLFFHSQALPLNRSLLIYPLWSQSVSVSAITILNHTYTLQTDRHTHTTMTSLSLSCTPFSLKSFDYLVTEA